MTTLRKGCAYRRLERPYTRKSKYRKKAFIKANPVLKVVRYDMGELDRVKFPYTLRLISKDTMQFRDNAIESARMTCNRLLEIKIGKVGYHLKIRIYPHHVLRENPLASGAGADRMSTGMQLSFGKPIGNAARVKKGQIIFELGIDKQHLEIGKRALKRASYKIPGQAFIEVIENKV